MENTNTKSGIDHIIFETVKKSFSENNDIETSFHVNENYRKVNLEENKIIYNLDTNIEKQNKIRGRIKLLLEK